MNGLKLFHHSPNVANGSQYTSFLSNKISSSPTNLSTTGNNSARRKLFNLETDSDQTAALRVDLLNKFQNLRRNQSAKWNFDFGREMPLPGPYAWFKSESMSLASSPVISNAINNPPNNNFVKTLTSPQPTDKSEQTILSPTSPFALFFTNQSAASAQPCFNLECNNCTSTLTVDSHEINSKFTKSPIIHMHQTKITDYFHHHKRAALSSPITPPDSVLKKGSVCKRPHVDLEDGPDSKSSCYKRLAFNH